MCKAATRRGHERGPREGATRGGPRRGVPLRKRIARCFQSSSDLGSRPWREQVVVLAASLRLAPHTLDHTLTALSPQSHYTPSGRQCQGGQAGPRAPGTRGEIAATNAFQPARAFPALTCAFTSPSALLSWKQGAPVCLLHANNFCFSSSSSSPKSGRSGKSAKSGRTSAAERRWWRSCKADAGLLRIPGGSFRHTPGHHDTSRDITAHHAKTRRGVLRRAASRIGRSLPTCLEVWSAHEREREEQRRDRVRTGTKRVPKFDSLTLFSPPLVLRAWTSSTSCLPAHAAL